MELARILGSNYPYRTQVPVYDAATLAQGEMLMRHGSWHSSETKYYITAYANANTGSEDSIGITLASSADCALAKDAQLYKVGSDGIPDAAISAGGNFMPVIVNPEACYYANYDAADAKSCTTAISASTTWTITSLEDNIDGGWLFTTDTADSSATYPGLIRYAAASASGSITTGVAVTVDTNTDFVKVLPIGHRLTGLNAAATGLTTTIEAEDGIFLGIAENWIKHQSSPKVRLRYWDHKGLDNLVNLKVDAEIVQLRHAYRAVVA